MKTEQPVWKEVAQLGDVNWIEEGGLFVYKDETGVYPPEIEKLFFCSLARRNHWVSYRGILEPCTLTDGILSDTKFHPKRAAWFAKSLEGVASYIGQPLDELVLWFLSADLKERARAWEAVGDYHGWENLDSNPWRSNDRAAVLARFTAK
jgi:hypothetical protein